MPPVTSILQEKNVQKMYKKHLPTIFNRLKKKPVKIGKLNIRPLIIYVYIVIMSTLVELLTTYIIDFMKYGKTYADHRQTIIDLEKTIRLLHDAQTHIGQTEEKEAWTALFTHIWERHPWWYD